MWSSKPKAAFAEKQVVLSGPSVVHTPDTAEVKSSRTPTDHSTLGPCFRRHVNSVMRASFPKHVLVMLLSTYWQRPHTINLEWRNPVQQNHAQTDNARWDLGENMRHHSHTDITPPFSKLLSFMLCISVYLKIHPLLNHSRLLTEKFNDSCRALCISFCYWQSFISLLCFPHPASEG